MAYDRSDNEARLQRKLVPLNIVVCILCLVSAISLVFAPLIKINLSEIKEVFMEMIESEGNSEGTDGNAPDFEAVFDSLEDEISITALDIGKFAYSNESVLMPLVISAVETMVIPAVSQGVLEGLDVDTTDIDFSKLNEKFEAFNHVDSEEDMRVAAGEWIDEIIRIGDLEINSEGRAQIIENFVDIYYDTIEVTNGKFDIEKMLCVFASEGLELEKPVTSYAEFLEEYFNNTEDGEVSEAYEMLMQADELIKSFAKGVFWLVMFPAITWLILFLFSLLHIFAKNKRFVMWYVKLFGGIPWLLFGFAPMVLGGALASVGEEMAIAASVFGAITSLTWISGVCLGLLWLVSIFWAFPIKHKIRADRKG